MVSKHLFIIDPLKDLNVSLDSSLRIARSLHAKGCHTYVCELKDLGISPEGLGRAHASCITFATSKDDHIEVHAEAPTLIDFGDFRSIHMRKDPPTDQQYFAATWILDRAPKGTLVVNHPEALRGLNEKLLVFDFPTYCDKAIVSSDPEDMLQFAKTYAQQDIIIKPLTMFGGFGVTRVQTSDKQAALTHIQELLASDPSPRIIQPFNQAIFDGEVRAFSAFGEIIACCLKKPAPNEYLANTSRGATLHAHEPTRAQKEAILSVSKSLLARGIYFIGFDIIGDKISEVNITSPRLLAKPLAAEHFDHIASLLIGFPTRT